MSCGYLLTTAVMTAAPRPKLYSQVLPVITQMEPSPHIRTCECDWWHTDQCCEELFPGDEQETILTIKHTFQTTLHYTALLPGSAFVSGKSLWSHHRGLCRKGTTQCRGAEFMSKEHLLNTDKSQVKD